MTSTVAEPAVGLPQALHRVAVDALAAPVPDGRLHLQRDGAWLWGALDVDDGGDLEAAAHAAYGQVFAALRDAGAPRLLRLWNYLPRIHDDEAGLERYRRFNAGRQRAFIEAGASAFEGAPAACALGRRGGPLGLRFLAAPLATRTVENPRQVPAWRYDTRFGPKSPSFSRALVAELGAGRELLLVSGTASIAGQESLHHGDVAAQTQETLVNLRAVCSAAGARFDVRQLQSTVYLRDLHDRGAVQPLLEAAGLPVVAWLQADVCRRELLVEIEGHAVA